MSRSVYGARKPMKYDKFEKILCPTYIDEWQRSLEVNRNTQTTYLSGLMAFLGHVQQYGCRFDKLGKYAVREFRNALIAQKYSPSTISLYMAGLRSFCRFMEDEYGVTSIASDVKGVRTTRQFKKDVLSKEMAKELLGSIETETLAGMRDYAIINLMIRTGLRDVEVARASTGDIAFPEGEQATLYIQGKGHTSKDQFVVLEEAAHSPIRNYLLARGWQGDNEPLFASLSDRNRGKNLTPNSISRIVKNRFRAIGIDDSRYTAHSLRHTAVTFSLLGGATVQEAQAMARHADINTTIIYAHNVQRLISPAEEKVGAYLDDIN